MDRGERTADVGRKNSAKKNEKIVTFEGENSDHHSSYSDWMGVSGTQYRGNLNQGGGNGTRNEESLSFNTTTMCHNTGGRQEGGEVPSPNHRASE